MALFEDFVRTNARPRRQNESRFEYLNTSARPGICAIRDLLETWFDHLPCGAQADISGRLRSREDVQHQSAFFELFWHELLRSSGYQITIHPSMTDVARNPDFLARRYGASQFYLEATLAMPPGDAAADRRLAELHDTLDRMDSPDYFLEFEYRGSAVGNIRGRELRERLEGWLRQLNFVEISRLRQGQEYGAAPTFTWSEQGLSLTFTPIPKGPQFRGQQGARPIGVVMPMEMRELRTHDDIRTPIEGKATKYGALELPLVVAVNIMDDFCEDLDVWNALFGEEQFVAIRQADGRWQNEWGPRVPNGAWRGRSGPRNTVVSAVVVTHQLSPSNLRTHAVELIHNPWATHPFPAESLNLVQRTVDVTDGHIHRRDGPGAADILAIPEPWPVPNDRQSSIVA
jgi:hypothetical protein